jgi:Holliday junction DNA helicase RuvA
VFSRIRGKVVERGEDRLVLEAGGLAYEIALPPCIAEKVAGADQDDLALEIHSVLNLDGNAGRFSFYGFTNAALISVASIGPKSAARAFSQPMARIAHAIEQGDHGFLQTLPGIGQQKARDIVAKLQGKVTKFLLIQEGHPPAHPPIPDFADEALAVLLQLEYKRAEAEAMVRSTLQAAPKIDNAESLLAEIYRQKAT